MKTLEELQSSLGLAAKADRQRRFYTLHDKMCRMDILQEAWRRVRANHGAPGIDDQGIEEIENRGVDQFLSELRQELRAETYRVQCVKRVFIPKPNGGMRPLGIPTVKDRVVQQAVRLVIEPIFETDFQPFSYGYRPNKSAKDASLQVRKWLNFRLDTVIDVDIEGLFDHIDHDKLISFVMERIADGYIIKLVKEWLRAGVVYLGSVTYPEEGTPQGGVISPLLANIYLNTLDSWWVELGMDRRYGRNAQMVRYADDIVILTDSSDAKNTGEILEGLLSELGLLLNKDKSRIITSHQGFDFLGFHYVRKYDRRKGRSVVRLFPSERSITRFRNKVSELAAKRYCNVKSEEQLVSEVNRVILGWTAYFNHSNASRIYHHLQSFVEWLLVHFIRLRHKKTISVERAGTWLYGRLGLEKLYGRISYVW